MFIADVLLCKLVSDCYGQKFVYMQHAISRQYPTEYPSELNTSDLVELLQKSAVNIWQNYVRLRYETSVLQPRLSQQTLRRCTRTNMATISTVYSCLHRTYTRCWTLFSWSLFQYILSFFSFSMTTLSHWLRWHSLLIPTVDGNDLAMFLSLSWLCRCIWWLNVSWSYVTPWRHWLRHLSTLKPLTTNIQFGRP